MMPLTLARPIPLRYGRTDASLGELPNLIREETQVESQSQTPRRNIVTKRQVRDRVIDGEEAIGTDRVLMRVGGCVFVWGLCVCVRGHACVKLRG